MTLDDDNWSDYFDAINVGAERVRAAVSLARVPLSPAPAGRASELGAQGGYLEGIRYDRRADEIEIAICQNGAAGASVRYFVSAPRSVSVEDGDLSKLISITDSSGHCTLVSLVSFGPVGLGMRVGEPGRRRALRPAAGRAAFSTGG